MKKHFNFIIRAVDLLLPTACLIVTVVCCHNILRLVFTENLK